MKFLVSKDIHANENFILLLGFYALMLLFYFIGDLFYLADFFGHNPKEIIATLRGNPDEFIEPLSLLSFLEHLHVSLFLALLALFTTMAIVLRLRLSHAHKKSIILIAMTSLLFAFLSLLATYFIAPLFAYSFMAFTLVWHLSSGYALVMILLEVWKIKT